MPNTPPIQTVSTPVTWETVRSGLTLVQALGKRYLLGKAFVGWQLSVLKSQSGIFRGNTGKNRSADSADLIPWPELVKRETGLERRAADELIRIWEAGLAKHKRLRGPVQTRELITYLENSDPLSIASESSAEAADFVEHFSSIVDGETAASLMQQLGVIPKPKGMPQKTGGKDKREEPTAGQLAFHFFDGVAAPLINARCNPDYKLYLMALPLHSDAEHPLSLATLEAEARALIADIEEVKQASAKPARGKLINV